MYVLRTLTLYTKLPLYYSGRSSNLGHGVITLTGYTHEIKKAKIYRYKVTAKIMSWITYTKVFKLHTID